jgi:hypothetical protein
LEDLPLIIEAIHNNNDSLRLFFGCKALRKILSTGDQSVVKHVMKQDQISLSLCKRLI